MLQGFQQLFQSFVDRGVIKKRHSGHDSSPAYIAVKDVKGLQFLADLVYPFIAGAWVSTAHMCTEAIRDHVAY